MKKLFLGLCLSLPLSTFASDFICTPSKFNENPYLANSYAMVSVEGEQLRFKHFTGVTNHLLRDYLYRIDKLITSKGQTSGKLKYVLEKEIKNYGDNILELYIDPKLLEEKNGVLMFTGWGYSWDKNFCRLINK